MKKISIVFLLLTASAFGRHKVPFEKLPGHPDRRLRLVHTMYIKGNNEAANLAKQMLESTTCFKLSRNAGTADAILEIGSKDSESKSLVFGRDVKSVVSATVTNSSGDELFSLTESFNSGIVNSGMGSATKIVLANLKEAGCGQEPSEKVR